MNHTPKRPGIQTRKLQGYIKNSSTRLAEEGVDRCDIRLQLVNQVDDVAARQAFAIWIQLNFQSAMDGPKHIKVVLPIGSLDGQSQLFGLGV